MIGLLMVMGLMMVVGCGGDSDSPTGPSEEITKWRKSFGDGNGYSVQQTVDGGFITTGSNGSDVLLLKADAEGNEEWNKIIHDSDYDSSKKIKQISDGGYIILGSKNITSGDNGGQSETSPWLIKIDSEGNEEWSQNYDDGTEDSSDARDFIQTPDNGYIILSNEVFHGTTIAL